MKATVKFNDDGEPYRLEVSERNGHIVSFAIRDETAIAQSVKPPEGEPEVYLDCVSAFMEYAETIPFVEETRLQESEGVE